MYKLFIIIMILSSFLYGEIDTLDTYYFDQVVITGTRTASRMMDLPQSLSVINQNILENQKQQPLLDIVSENIPGLFVSNRTNVGYGIGSGSGGNITMRGVGGFPNTQVLVMIDGRPDVMGLFGHPLGDAYISNNVEKIEVIRGSASLLYGSNAMGGVINIITKDIVDEGFEVMMPMKFSSWNTQNIGITQKYGKGNLGYIFSGNYKSSDGFRDMGKDDYQSTNYNLVTNYKLSKQIKMKANLYLTDYEIFDPGQISNPFINHNFNIRRAGGDFSLLHNQNKLSGTLKLHHNFGHHDIWDGYKSDDFMSGIILTETYYYTDKSNITFGFDGRILGGKALIGEYWKEKNVNEISGLVNLHHFLTDEIILETGTRYTKHSVTGIEIIPAFGTVLKLPKQYNIKLQYSKGYRNPTINEMYLFRPSTDELKAEISETYEVSLEKSLSKYFHAGITVYNTDLTNLIEKTMPIPMQPIYNNVGKVDMQGVELDAELLLPPAFSINFTYSYNNISKTIVNSPGQKMNLNLRYSNSKIYVKLQGEYLSDLYSLENPYSYAPPLLVKTDNYFIMSFHTNYKLNQYFSCYGKVDNIFDKNYEIMYGFPMPGRMFTFGITTSYK